jgi:hypothetical protein
MATPQAARGTECPRRKVHYVLREGSKPAGPRRDAARFTRARPGEAGRALIRIRLIWP